MLTLTRPDDWHIHLRDHAFLERTVADVSRVFSRAIVMPNLSQPVTDVHLAHAYRERILKYIPSKTEFTPLMTLYLTSDTRVETIVTAKESGIIWGCKLYPQGATTNSAHGVQSIEALYPVFEALAQHQIVLQIHGEVVDPKIDIFEREKIFIETVLTPIIEKFPHLKIVLEHITTAFAVDYIKQASHSNLAATITAHHLYLNRNDLLVGGIKPHFYCLPVVKQEQDRQALIQAAISGHPQFFLGTDSAPHSVSAKESACGCAGIYTSHAAIELYAEIFDQYNALQQLEGFASFYGADFYGLPRNTSSISLTKQPQHIPDVLTFGTEKLIPFKARENLSWQVLK
jgi:dihydroorotase